MNKKNYLNMALLIIGISIVILGAVLYFTVPVEIKDSFKEIHINSYALENEKWNFLSGRGAFPGYHDFAFTGFHGGIWFFPLAILVLVLVIGIRKRAGSHYLGHSQHGYAGSPMDILHRSYANGKMTRAEYLERKNILEQEKEA